MKLTPTQYEGDDGNWQYSVSCYKGKWTIRRWPSTGPKIPPQGQILADTGWKPMLGNTTDYREFDSLDALTRFVFHSN